MRLSQRWLQGFISLFCRAVSIWKYVQKEQVHYPAGEDEHSHEEL